jgi:ribA/ribD-fused uncharacterized protein
MPVYFYRVNEPYGEFSNFSKHPFEADGKNWPTSEHYFQAQKFVWDNSLGDSQTRCERQRGGENWARPKLAHAARLGSVKLDAMRSALRHKFRANPELVQLLLSTGDEEIVEQTSDDVYWGCGTSRDGLNMLGILLMELRDTYRKTLSLSGDAVEWLGGFGFF